ncbi:hypothetical protein [Vibrio harveyi]|uniref:hypothetical protein n=1 Tax=Vibrio harveyi TaxID=669 RepID=UPI0018F1FFBE|nr:hypothetical protein [Vibrio harveyi]
MAIAKPASGANPFTEIVKRIDGLTEFSIETIEVGATVQRGAVLVRVKADDSIRQLADGDTLATVEILGVAVEDAEAGDEIYLVVLNAVVNSYLFTKFIDTLDEATQGVALEGLFNRGIALGTAGFNDPTKPMPEIPLPA